MTLQRICLLSREYPPDTAWGGIARAVHAEARALATAGIEVHVISLAPSGIPSDREEDGIAVHRIPEPALEELPADLTYVRLGLWSRAVAERYWELDWELGFDAVEAPDYYAEALHLFRRPETPLAIWLHTMLGLVWEHSGETPDGNQRGWAALEAAALRQADILIAPSSLIADETRRLVGAAIPPARVVPYVFDHQPFQPRLLPHAPESEVRCAFIGRLEPRKGADLALRAVAAARASGLETRLELVGRDDFGYRWELDELVEELDLSPYISFRPEVDEAGVVEHLHRVDCALLPSRFESFHLAALEALSCGVPVVTSDRTGVGTLFGRHTGMVRIPVDDADAFATAAAGALGDTEWLERSGRRAAEQVRALFDPAAIAARIIALHEELAAAKAGHGTVPSGWPPQPARRG